MYNILFVEDEEAICLIISRMKLWSESKFKITKSVRNGKEALDVLEKESFDIIITDIRMPVMDGLELLETIRAKGDKTLVILASTYSEFEYAKKGIQFGAMDYLLKPITEDGLREVLKRAEILLKERESEKNSKSMIIPKEDIERLYKDMINSGIGIEKLITEFKDCAAKFSSGNEEVYCNLLEYIFEEIWKKTLDLFSWLGKVENIEWKLVKENIAESMREKIILFRSIAEKYNISNVDSVINRVCTYIVDNIGCENVLDKAAEEVELSRDYVSKIFKNTIGITMIEYLTMLKMEYAENLLCESSMRIYEISETLGYLTVDYFSRLFKKYTGVTPMQYRKKNMLAG